MNVLPSEELSFEQINSYIEKHFLLKENISSISDDGLAMDVSIVPTHSWITPNLADTIKEHLQKKIPN